MLDLVGKDGEAKARRWFKGAASLSESLVTSAVEEVALGVSEFQTNAVLAAAAATFAGTVARKATQHVFLAEVGV
jgi:anti-sigma regulatory factor (Ser/Thr protein kinase)